MEWDDNYESSSKIRWAIISEDKYVNEVKGSSSIVAKLKVIKVKVAPIGIFNFDTLEKYPCAYNNKIFKDKESALKCCANYLKVYRESIIEMQKCINEFNEEYPNLMI